jgi:hypothetical protein
LPPRVRFAEGLRWAVAAARAGGAALGLAVFASSPEPELVLGLIAIVLVVIGGATWTPGGRSPVLLRIVLSLATIVLARLALGPSGAAVAVLLLAMGAWLRIRLADAILGLAVFGAAVAALGGASPGLVLVFWMLGLAIALLRPLVVRISRYLARPPSLTIERTKAARLGPEN